MSSLRATFRYKTLAGNTCLYSSQDYSLHTDKNEKEEFFSKEFFTINKEIFPYCQGIIFLPYP
jgi:hypothetical protein